MTDTVAGPPAPWLSVLIPVYNVQAYLAECVQSVLAQADDGVEVLLLDDCSTDGSPALMRQLAAQWPGRLRCLQHERNGGLSAARNTLIEAAQGQYLWFLDSDDKLLPGAIAQLQAIVQRHAPDLVLCDFRVWREKPRLKHVLRGENHRRSFAGPAGQCLSERASLLSGLLRTGQLHAWSKISRRALWTPDLRFPPGRYFEDMMTLPLLALKARHYYYQPRPWIAYRQRSSSILATMNLGKALDQAQALLPLRRALQGDALAGDAALQFALAHQAARNLIGAMRYVARQPPGLEMQAAADAIRAHFEASSLWTASTLQRVYLQRGWWLRCLKFRRAWGTLAP
ncbi:MAG: glycosyltransferase family 2 protein [Simplicispira sp.]|nr:glycosyltransferase family 2 protein [Simplicispira sp.]